jgi:hypothetical protein
MQMQRHPWLEFYCDNDSTRTTYFSSSAKTTMAIGAGQTLA